LQEGLQAHIEYTLDYLALRAIDKTLQRIKAEIEEALGGSRPTVPLEEEEGYQAEDGEEAAGQGQGQQGGVPEGGEQPNFLEHRDNFDLHVHFAAGSIEVH
jgi:hypothetical protein